MSPAYHIATDDGLITLQAGGELDLIEIRRLVESVLAAEDYDPELPLLIDLRDLRVSLEPEPTGEVSAYIIEHFRGRRGSMAVVVDGEMNRKLTAAIYWLACAVGNAEVFDDYDQALKWLIRREFAGTAATG